MVEYRPRRIASPEKIRWLIGSTTTFGMFRGWVRRVLGLSSLPEPVSEPVDNLAFR
jgi:hypothetical protein